MGIQRAPRERILLSGPPTRGLPDDGAAAAVDVAPELAQPGDVSMRADGTHLQAEWDVAVPGHLQFTVLRVEVDQDCLAAK